MNYKKKMSVTALAMVMTAFSVMQAFGASYNDIQRHWAKDYIEKVSQYKLISGYEDGRFKPDSDVTRLEAIIMTCNLFSPTLIEQTYNVNISKWKSKFQQYNIPDWSWKYVVFALEKKIIPSSDAMLASLMSKTNKKQQIKALKYEAVVFLVNALGWADQRSTAVVLKYKDTSKINPQARPYIDVLIKKGIIGEKGDNNGNFGAHKGVTRGEMALMLANSYRYSQRATGTNTPSPTSRVAEITQPSVVETKTVSTTGAVVSNNREFSIIDGTVISKNTVGDEASLLISDNSGKMEIYTNKISDIQVKRLNNKATFMDINDGDKIRLLATADRKVTSVILSGEDIVQGTFSGVNASVNIQVKTGNKVVDYMVNEDALITLNGHRAQLSDIKVDDSVDLRLSNGRVREIRAVSARSPLAEQTQDSARIQGAFRLRNAVIKEIRLATAGNRLIVQDVEGRNYDLSLNHRTAIRFQNAKSDVNALRVGYMVDVYANGSEAEEIITYGEYKALKVDGVVVNVDERNRFIEVELSRKEVVKVYYDSNTIIEDARGFHINPSRIYRGDKVTATGYEGIGGIDAGRIIVDMPQL